MRFVQKFLMSLVAFAVLFSAQAIRAQDYPSQEEHEWVEKHYLRIFEENFSFKKEPKMLLLFGYRFYKDLYNENEHAFEITKSLWENELTARIKTVDGEPLYEQIMRLHRKNPQADIEVIKRDLKFKEATLSEKTCPAVKKQYDDFNNLSLPMLSARDRAEKKGGGVTLTLHPPVHAFEASISGGTMKLVIDEWEHPFVVWAEKTRKAFEKCSAKPN